MLRRILCVDDEPNILQAFERQFHRRFEMQTALGAKAGLRMIVEQGPFAVVVSDLRMPEMDGVRFLARVHQLAPDTVRVMLTGQADLAAAISAVNQGHVFQFLTKPCPTDLLGHILDAALEHHRQVAAERELLEQTLRSSIGVMSEILSLVSPVAFGRAERIRGYVLHIAKELSLADQWQYELAAVLSQVGCVAMPPDILRRYYDGQPLDPTEQALLASHPRIGRDLLAKIPRLEAVAEMVAHQHTPWKEAESPPASVKIGAHLLRVAIAFDELVTRGTKPEVALEEMRERGVRPLRLVDALESLQVERAASEVRQVGISQLKTGMITTCGVYLKTGILLIAEGQEITDPVIARLRTFAATVGIVEPISVTIPGPVAMQSPDALLGDGVPSQAVAE